MNNYVLLIDNDNDEHLIFISVMESMKSGYGIRTSFDLTAAFRIMEYEMPAMIFLDINMPRNGFECLKTIKGIEKFRNIPVYFYSGQTHNQETILLAKDLGANGVIGKKDDTADLRKSLTDLFQQKKQDSFLEL